METWLLIDFIFSSNLIFKETNLSQKPWQNFIKRECDQISSSNEMILYQKTPKALESIFSFISFMHLILVVLILSQAFYWRSYLMYVQYLDKIEWKLTCGIPFTVLFDHVVFFLLDWSFFSIFFCFAFDFTTTFVGYRFLLQRTSFSGLLILEQYVSVSLLVQECLHPSADEILHFGLQQFHQTPYLQVRRCYHIECLAWLTVSFGLKYMWLMLFGTYIFINTRSKRVVSENLQYDAKLWRTRMFKAKLIITTDEPFK